MYLLLQDEKTAGEIARENGYSLLEASIRKV